jgi:hypothetical protein
VTLKAAEQAKMDALDPAISPDPKKARAAMEDAVFSANRLRTLSPRLWKRHDSVAYTEARAAVATRWSFQAAGRGAKDVGQANRKALPAALLAYPSFVGQAAFNAAASLHT